MNCSMLKTGAGGAMGFGAGMGGGKTGEIAVGSGGGTVRTSGFFEIGIGSRSGIEAGTSISGSTGGAKGGLGESSSR